MAAAISLMLVFMQDRVFPSLQLKTETILRSLSIKSHKLVLREKEFIEGLGNYIFYIHSITGDRMKDIIVYEPVGNNTARIITAREGKYQTSEKDKVIAFHLVQGTFDEPKSPESKTFYKMKFDSYMIKIPLQDNARIGMNKGLKEMTFGELFAKKKSMRKDESYMDTRPIDNEFFKRITLSFSVLILSILSIPLSIRVHRSEKSVNFALALGTIVLYYVLLAAGEAASLKGVLHPSIMTSLPNIVFGVAGGLLYLNMAKK
jgi:lipopolysaccharide export system permease protein